ncbi:hypothetical protein RhiJN_26251 [Ceratobasidium sp. AG-Ba]|nr:hypothetical protein RhiJN_26251 [Ceratobasidium sp. AG-Ba]
MHASTRFASLLFLFLSLFFAASALPSGANVGSNQLAARTQPDNVVVSAVAALKAQLTNDIATLPGCTDVGQATKVIVALIGHIDACTALVAQTKVQVNVEAAVKAQVAADAAFCIMIVVKACLDLVIKFGLSAFLVIFAKLDLCISQLVADLNICMVGIVTVIGKLIAGATANGILELHFSLCAGAFALFSV